MKGSILNFETMGKWAQIFVYLFKKKKLIKLLKIKINL
jgi:hypothetical protein